MFSLTLRLTHCDAVLWRGPILAADARARDRAPEGTTGPSDSQCWPAVSGRLSDSGSGMGAARLGQAASDAVIVTVHRPLTCADAVTWPVWPVEHCIRDLIYDRCRRVLGSEDRETLYAANALAIFLGDSGELERARELHEETLQKRLRLFPNHRDWLYSANRLAGVLRELGDIARARDLFEETYEKCRRILGPDSIETLNVAGRGLAQALDDLGERDRARRLRYDIYNRCSRVFGPHHPVTVQLRRELDS